MNLVRVDYSLLGLTNPRCLKLLPSSSRKGVQKIAVGDSNGIVQVFFFKKGELHQVFKSLPGPPISCLVLGGAIGNPFDKIFVASRHEVRGFSKKGKLFLSFDTNRTEDIKYMYVNGSDLLVAGDHVLNYYIDCKEVGEFICPDGITDIISLHSGKVVPLSVIIGSKASELLVVEKSILAQKYSLPNPPSVFHLFNNDGGSARDLLLVGFQDGQIALYQIPKGGPLGTKWILQNDKGGGEVSCLYCYDITGDGLLDLLVGRQDGSIEVYSIPEQDDLINITPFPVEKFAYTCNESIMSIYGGVVGNAGFDEIVAATYTGWLFGLTTEVMDKQISGQYGNSSSHFGIPQQEKLKITRLKGEIEELELKVAKEREKYQNLTQVDSTGFSTIPLLSVRDKMVLCKEDASYQLTFEVETTIDNILVQSDVPIELLDIDKNSAVVSHSTCDIESGNYILATYRCQINTTRLELKFKTVEGCGGTMRVYITPLIHPKCCLVRRYQIKPLSHHTRTNTFDTSRPCNTLILKGSFSILEMHSWINQCLPEVPEKLPVGNKVFYSFQSVSVGTTLSCDYRRNEAEFKSDNVSTIAILKDILTKDATEKRIKLDISCSITEACMKATIKLIFPHLSEAFSLLKQVKLLEALKDMEANSPDFSSERLTTKYRDILNNQNGILRKFNSSPKQAERLVGVVKNLHRDWLKLKGIANKFPSLDLDQTLKENTNPEFLYDLFEV